MAANWRAREYGNGRGDLISKVPHVTVTFWIIKVLATTVGDLAHLPSRRQRLPARRCAGHQDTSTSSTPLVIRRTKNTTRCPIGVPANSTPPRSASRTSTRPCKKSNSDRQCGLGMTLTLRRCSFTWTRVVGVRLLRWLPRDRPSLA